MSTTTANVTTMTPVEIDTELARLWNEVERERTWLASDRKSLTSRYMNSWDRPTTEARIIEREARIVALRDEAEPFEMEYMRRGMWNRYFLVTNGNGHVHRGTNCSTCYATTLYAWLIDLADCDEAAMIEEWGERACTVCFPDAPVNPFYNRPARVDREAREARAAEKAAREATKAAKAITDVDGSPLKDASGWEVRTKIAARNALADAVVSYGYYGPEHSYNFPEAIKRLSRALEAAGIDTAPVIARAIKRAAKEGAPNVWKG